MTAPLTPERLAKIRPLGERYIHGGYLRQQRAGYAMALEWEQLVDQAAAIDRLRAQVADAWDEGGEAERQNRDRVRGRIDNPYRAALSGDEVQP